MSEGERDVVGKVGRRGLGKGSRGLTAAYTG